MAKRRKINKDFCKPMRVDQHQHTCVFERWRDDYKPVYPARFKRWLRDNVQPSRIGMDS